MSVSVSETIGKLLLEGYKMLADSCDVCCTVLMQDRRGRIICVQCESAAMANATQESMNMNSSSGTGKMINGTNGSPSLNNFNQDPPTLQRNIPTVVPTNNSNSITNRTPNSNSSVNLLSIVSNSEDAIAEEIRVATQALAQAPPLNLDIQARAAYLKHIKECAETLRALKALKSE